MKKKKYKNRDEKNKDHNFNQKKSKNRNCLNFYCFKFASKKIGVWCGVTSLIRSDTIRYFSSFSGFWLGDLLRRKIINFFSFFSESVCVYKCVKIFSKRYDLFSCCLITIRLINR